MDSAGIVAPTQRPRTNVKPLRVLVTGASGFVGRSVIAALLRAGYSVRAATRDPARISKLVEIAVVPDFIETVDWRPVVQNIDVVIHSAGFAHVDRIESYGPYAKINYISTLQLAHAAKEARVSRFIYLSSIRAQIGASSPQAVRELDEPHPTDHYGRSKFAAEQAVRLSGVPFTILRPAAIYGPNPKGNVRTLLALARSPLPLPIKTFENRRSLLGIDNLIDAILFSLQNEATTNETFLVADPDALTLPQIFTALRKMLGRPPGLFRIPRTVTRLVLFALGQGKLWSRVGEDLVVDTSKLQSIGWRPPVTTYDGFRAMLTAEEVGLR